MMEPDQQPDPDAKQAKTFSAWQVWLTAISKPKVEAYQELLADPLATKNRGYVFFLIGTTVSVLVSLSLQYLLPTGDMVETSSLPVVALLCGLPIGVALALLFFAAGVAIISWIARQLGGEGNFDEMVYLTSAWYAPYLLLSSVIAIVSAVLTVAIGLAGSCLLVPISIGIGLYGIALEAIAIKSSHGISWGRSIAAVMVPIVIAAILFLSCWVLLVASLFAL